MTFNAVNPVLYNAAIAGIISAAAPGNPVAGTVAATVFQEVTAVAVVVAQAIDAAITIDATITGAGTPNTTLPGDTSAAVANALSAKAGLMRGLCGAAFRGQTTVSLVSGAIPNQANIVAGIVAKYTAGIAAPFSLL